jgi:NAD(P)H dehydrogenase (quinone)
MKIGVTGAGGQMGSALVRHAASRVHAPNVVAVTRNPSKLEAFSQQGVEVRAGDFNQPSGLAAAFRGIERLIIIPTGDLQPGLRISQHTAAIKAAAAAGVRHVIYISTVSPRPDPDNELFLSHFATEQALVGSGVNWTILRMSVFMDTLADAAKRAAASGVYSGVLGAPAAYVTRDDIAAAAAGILAGPGHDGITYHATGSVSIGQAEISELIAEAAGTKVNFVEMTEEQQRAGWAAAGLPAPVINVIAGFQAALRAGAFDLVSRDVERLSGQPAESPVAFLARVLAGTATGARG